MDAPSGARLAQVPVVGPATQRPVTSTALVSGKAATTSSATRSAAMARRSMIVVRSAGKSNSGLKARGSRAAGVRLFTNMCVWATEAFRSLSLQMRYRQELLDLGGTRRFGGRPLMLRV